MKTVLFATQVEKVSSDGSRVIAFSNGTRKEISADGQSRHSDLLQWGHEAGDARSKAGESNNFPDPAPSVAIDKSTFKFSFFLNTT